MVVGVVGVVGVGVGVVGVVGVGVVGVGVGVVCVCVYSNPASLLCIDYTYKRYNYSRLFSRFLR